jgi:hypothetical protein
LIWRRLLLALLFSVGLVAPVARMPAACAASPHHAALIVDTGDRVERRCVAFPEDAISGKDVLDRAAVGVVYREYSYGAAVCSILGVGNSADDCLGERSGNFWTYYRAAKGSVTFTPSSQGVSTSEVKDGDVDGWHWKTGVPPYAPVSDVCAEAASTAPTAATAATTAVATTATPVSTRRVGGVSSITPEPTDTSTTAAATTSTGPTTSTTARPQLALPVKNEKGGSPWGLAALGALLAGIGVATWRINRRRNP